MPKDIGKAIELYGKASALGNAFSEFMLGEMYQQEDSAPKDVAKAIECYRKAADMGNLQAQMKLGDMYEHGTGVTRDIDMAIEYYGRAANKGYGPAKRKIDQLRAGRSNERSAMGSQSPETEDCIRYDPVTLKIIDQGPRGWLLAAGPSRMFYLDTKADAEEALAVAKQYTNLCFVGRNNKRNNPRDYIVEYWKGDSANELALPSQDCSRYDPAALKILDEGTNGWCLTDGRSRMKILDNQADAEQLLAVARRHTYQCFIGRNNKRPNRKEYIVNYWK